MCVLGTRFCKIHFLGGSGTQGRQCAEQGNIYVFHPAVGKAKMGNTIWQTCCVSEGSSVFFLENFLKICKNTECTQKLESCKILRMSCLHFVNIALKKAFLARIKRVPQKSSFMYRKTHCINVYSHSGGRMRSGKGVLCYGKV